MIQVLVALILVALIYVYLESSQEPRPSPSPTLASAGGETPRFTLEPWTISPASLDGGYCYSDGYSGESLKLQNGEFEWNSFSCDSFEDVVASGTYKLEGAELVLSGTKLGGHTRFTVLPDRLISEAGGYRLVFGKTIDADGEVIPDAYFIPNRLRLPPPSSSERISNGQKLYKANCMSCHGSEGNGIQSSDSKSRTGILSQKGVYKYSYEKEWLYQAVAFGIEGTAMAPWNDILAEEEMWDLCFYLESIQK